MNNFIDHLHELMLQEANEIRRREADEQEMQVRIARQQMDVSHETEQLHLKAASERQVTLDLAWAAAGLLSLQKAPLTYWTQTERPSRRKIFTRGKTHASPRPAYAEGWPLAEWGNKYYPHRKAVTLVLTPRENELDTRLSFVIQSLTTDDKRLKREPQLEAVHPISKTPLFGEQPYWPERWPTFQSKFDSYPNVDFLMVPDISEDNRMRDYDVRRAYERYNEAQTEDHIRRAIARTAARHLIIDAEKSVNGSSDSSAIEE